MRSHITCKDVDTDLSSTLTIFNNRNFQPPSILEMIQSSNGFSRLEAESTNSQNTCLGLYQENLRRSLSDISRTGASSLSDQLSNLYSLEAVSLSQKRKILDSEKDYDERFRKIQRKRQLQRNAAKAHCVIDDDDDSGDEEDEIYRQMDWIEKENAAINMLSLDSSDEDESFGGIVPKSPVFFVPRSKWKEERRRLLRISMAKIRTVEDPESYLRRSVLINNTVKHLQDDVAMNLTCSSFGSSSLLQGNYAFESGSPKDLEQENVSMSIYKQFNYSDKSYNVGPASSFLSNDSIVHYNEQSSHADLTCNPVHFHVALASTFSNDRSFDISQQKLPPISNFNKSILEDQKLLPPIVLKQPSLHLFSSQPCGLQYRSIVQDEDSVNNLIESSHSASIIDSVVYHSLVASLET